MTRALKLSMTTSETGEPPGESEAAGAVQVEHDAPLAAHKRAGEAAAPVAEVGRAAPFHLDHVGAEIGEDAGRDRAGHHPGEVEHPDAVERAHQTIPCSRSVGRSTPSPR